MTDSACKGHVLKLGQLVQRGYQRMAFQTVELSIFRAAVRRTNIDAKDNAVVNLNRRLFLSHGLYASRIAQPALPLPLRCASPALRCNFPGCAGTSGLGGNDAF